MTRAERIIRDDPRFKEWVAISAFIRSQCPETFTEGIDERVALNAVANAYRGEDASVTAAIATLLADRLGCEPAIMENAIGSVLGDLRKLDS